MDRLFSETAFKSRRLFQRPTEQHQPVLHPHEMKKPTQTNVSVQLAGDETEPEEEQSKQEQANNGVDACVEPMSPVVAE